MSISANQVFAYLDANPISCHDGDLHSLLEMIHYVYASSNPIDSEQLRGYFRDAREILDKLSVKDADRLYSILCDQCLGYEYTAFSHGILVGMHLMTELNALP